MGVSCIRGVALRPRVVAQEDTVHQGSTGRVLADIMGIFKEFCFLGSVRNDL